MNNLKSNLGTSVIYNDMFLLETLKLALINNLLTSDEKLAYIEEIVEAMSEMFESRYKKHLERVYDDLYERR